MADAYYVITPSEKIPLSRGITKVEVEKLLGNNYWIKPCEVPGNERLVYRFLPGNDFYIIYFTDNQLVWVAKTNYINQALLIENTK